MVSNTTHVRQRPWVARGIGALALAVGLLAGSTLHADIVAASGQSASLCAVPALNVPDPTSASPLVVPLAGAAALPTSVWSSTVEANDGDLPGPLAVRAVADPLYPHPADPLRGERAVVLHDSSDRPEIAVPVSPGSLTVALSSLLTLGGWRLVRQARLVYLVCLPEWYHEGGPGQVGHAIPFDLNTRANVLPICWYQPDCLVVSSQPMAHYSRPERCAPWDSLYFIPTSAPRAPPSLS